MDLRSGTVVGGAAGPSRGAAAQQQQQQQRLAGAAKAGFEEGVSLIFSAWTALVLAVENQWGGPDSETKADYFIEDTLDWFYRKKGAAAACLA